MNIITVALRWFVAFFMVKLIDGWHMMMMLPGMLRTPLHPHKRKGIVTRKHQAFSQQTWHSPKVLELTPIIWLIIDDYTLVKLCSNNHCV